MTKLRNGYCLFVLLVAAGCAQRGNVVETDRLTKLSRQKRAIETHVEDQKFQNFLASAKAKAALKKRLSFAAPKSNNDEGYYSEVIGAYQRRELDAIQFYTSELIKKFPKSVFCDNALYLQGQLNLEMGLPAEALRDFERLGRDFPNSNKRAAALFGKGVAYRKLQLYDYSEKVFSDVKKFFRGSPEFYKVELEQKLLKIEKAG